jgi:preprotein translocase subunit YajC
MCKGVQSLAFGKRLNATGCYSMLYALILLADEAEKPLATPGILDNPFILLPLFVAIFYFTIILPKSRRQRQEQDSLMSGLKKNDEVVTASGIIGIVAHIKENGDEVTLKIDDNARIRVLRSSIVRIVKKEEPKDAAAAAANASIKPTT